MAGFFEDKLTCKECGHDRFEEKKVVTLRSEAKKMSRNTSEPYPDRFVDEKQILYVCLKCGTSI